MSKDGRFQLENKRRYVSLRLAYPCPLGIELASLRFQFQHSPISVGDLLPARHDNRDRHIKSTFDAMQNGQEPVTFVGIYINENFGHCMYWDRIALWVF